MQPTPNLHIDSAAKTRSNLADRGDPRLHHALFPPGRNRSRPQQRGAWFWFDPGTWRQRRHKPIPRFYHVGKRQLCIKDAWPFQALRHFSAFIDKLLRIFFQFSLDSRGPSDYYWPHKILSLPFLTDLSRDTKFVRKTVLGRITVSRKQLRGVILNLLGEGFCPRRPKFLKGENDVKETFVPYGSRGFGIGLRYHWF
jgi:hypothetical protein